jgi:molybdenum cofactor cytidylyltransferase
MRSVGAIVLAAGGSTRLGQPKQLLEIEGETLVRRTVNAANAGGCACVVAVLGGRRDRIAAELRDTSVEIVENDAWQRGLGTSIKCGVAHLVRTHLELDSVILLACDQPLVGQEVIRALIKHRGESEKEIIASKYAGTVGIPALFARSCFNALLDLPDASGAKPLIEADLGRVALLEFPAGAIDIDTPADLERWRGVHS